MFKFIWGYIRQQCHYLHHTLELRIEHRATEIKVLSLTDKGLKCIGRHVGCTCGRTFYESGTFKEIAAAFEEAKAKAMMNPGNHHSPERDPHPNDTNPDVYGDGGRMS